MFATIYKIFLVKWAIFPKNLIDSQACVISRLSNSFLMQCSKRRLNMKAGFLVLNLPMLQLVYFH